jgi:hypothetical protein
VTHGFPRVRSVVGEALLHPVALAALVLLVVNDHVLKSAYPGFVTGKLSDAAGLTVFPLFLHALLERGFRVTGASFSRWYRSAALAGAATTAFGFSLVKGTEQGAELFRNGLGAVQCLPHALSGLDPTACRARVVVDVTDLWALPFVLVSVRLLGRAQWKESPSSTPSDVLSTHS